MNTTQKLFKNWLYNKYSNKIPQSIIKILSKENIPKRWIVASSKIIHRLSEMPYYTQKQLMAETKLSKDDLIELNKIIRESDFLQDMIVYKGLGRKYWNTMLPYIKSGNINKVIDNEYCFPLRLAFFPGMSCMYYCGFCGRNQKARYDIKNVLEGTQHFKKIISSLPLNSTISISGGLEPLTNPNIGEIITHAKSLGHRVPLITNGHMLTPKFLERQSGIWDLDSLRVSLYGADEKSYFNLTRHPKAYKLVKKNIIEFLKERNRKKSDVKLGLNYLILPENMHTILPLLDYINEVNSNVDNGPGIDFLTIREDYGNVTVTEDDADKSIEGRKYHLEGFLSEEQRKQLITIFKEFNRRKDLECPNMHVDFGYAMVALGEGVLGKPLARVKGTEMRKSGYPQLSVIIDSNGDVFLYREAGFLGRPGNKKFIIGKVTNDKPIESVLKEFIENKHVADLVDSDSKFMDAYDHLITLLVNQAESDINIGIPFELGPVKVRSHKHNDLNITLSNNWYKDEMK